MPIVMHLFPAQNILVPDPVFWQLSSLLHLPSCRKCPISSDILNLMKINKDYLEVPPKYKACTTSGSFDDARGRISPQRSTKIYHTLSFSLSNAFISLWSKYWKIYNRLQAPICIIFSIKLTILPVTKRKQENFLLWGSLLLKNGASRCVKRSKTRSLLRNVHVPRNFYSSSSSFHTPFLGYLIYFSHVYIVWIEARVRQLSFEVSKVQYFDEERF